MSNAPLIPMTAEDAYYYARDVINGRWPEVEAVIATDPEKAYRYALNVIKGRWPEAESVIATNPYYAYAYAHDVINGRWPEAEARIMTNPYYAYLYALGVIKGRWPEAEAVIATDSFWYNRYQTFLTSLGGDAMSDIPSSWQPMETAPRDGTSILIWDSSGKCMVFGHWYDEWNDWQNDQNLCEIPNPSHWMPLPPAPF